MSCDRGSRAVTQAAGRNGVAALASAGAYAAGVNTRLADLTAERGRLLRPTPAGDLNRRLDRLAAIDHDLLALRRAGAIDDRQLREALTARTSPPAPSTAPVRWLKHRPAGWMVTARSQVDPTQTLRTRLRVVNADELKPSHLPGGGINPDFDPALQPRRRDRAASQAQIQAIANKLEPAALLNADARWDDGPPIVNQAGMVESGNGRTLALWQANGEKFAAYRAALIEQAESLGFDKAEVAALKRPVLVRERLDKLTKQAQLDFIATANSAGAATSGSAETARLDAARLPVGLASSLQVAPSDRSLAGVLGKKANAPLVSRWLATLPATEQSGLVTKDGQLGIAGAARLERALFAYSFPGDAGERLLARLFEGGEALDRIGAGIKLALPQLARLADRVKQGTLDPALSPGADLAAALDAWRESRAQKLSAADYLQQQTFLPRLTPLQREWLRQLDTRRRSGAKVAALLNAYVDAALAQPPLQQVALPDMPAVKSTSENILRQALKSVGGEWLSAVPTPAPTTIRKLPAQAPQASRRGIAWQERWQVASGKRKPYTVARDAKGRWGCTCPGWTYQRKPADAPADWWRSPCKHIAQVKQSL